MFNQARYVELQLLRQGGFITEEEKQELAVMEQQHQRDVTALGGEVFAIFRDPRDL